MNRKISTGKASWVSEGGEIDPAYMEWGAKQDRRVSTELIKPITAVVPHIHYKPNDDDIIDKMRSRGILASVSEANRLRGGI